MQKGSSEDDVRRSETDIEKLVLARDVLQEQIDARVVARDAQILEADPFCKAPKAFREGDHRQSEKACLVAG